MLSYLLISLVVASTVSARNLNSRNVVRSTQNGAVNLVEFNVRGTLYGRCSYQNDQGEKITVVFEEKGDEIKAKSSLQSVVDPVMETQLCREVAFNPQTEGRFQDTEESKEEDDEALGTRINQFLGKLIEDQSYVSSLGPRFVGDATGGQNTVAKLGPKFISFASQGTVDSTTSGFLGNIFGNFGSLGGITIDTVDIPIPVINIPVGIQNVPVPLILPSLQTVNIPKPVIGKK